VDGPIHHEGVNAHAKPRQLAIIDAVLPLLILQLAIIDAVSQILDPGPKKPKLAIHY
jgi:hypothetical protein